MTSLFCSYSHADEELRDRLEVDLAALKNEGIIDVWHDRRLVGGDDLDDTINEKMESADIVLCLLSPDFLASKYCHDIEMEKALERHEQGLARVIPVILRPCEWSRTPLAGLVAVPKDGRPITKWPDIDDAFLDIAKAIRAAVDKVCTKKPTEAGTDAVPIQPIRKASRPRSSNLRLRKTFTEADHDKFREEAFEYMSQFFEESLNELKTRNSNISVAFKKITVNEFTARIYQSGDAISECRVRLDSAHGLGSSITYSSRLDMGSNAFNESMSVEADDQSMFLKPLGFGMSGFDRATHLTFEGASEYYWGKLIEPLQ